MTRAIDRSTGSVPASKLSTMDQEIVSVSLPPDGGHSAAERGPITSRLDSVDLLRGLVMVLMALDHTRLFFSNARFDPLDLARTNAGLFLTRWVTHFCAPVFVFLAGTSAFLMRTRGKTRPQLALFLLTRGLWLLLLEFTLIDFSWRLDFNYHQALAQVLWAIGGSMIALAGLIFLPVWLITFLGTVIIACHSLFDGISAESLGSFAWVWTIWISGGPLQLARGVEIYVIYPLAPWLGVMLVGFGFGKMWQLRPGQRRRWLLTLGTGITLLFVLLRTINGYGDPHPWTLQSNGLWTIFSFIQCEKYPPSLMFLLMTLGPAIFLLAWCDSIAGPLRHILVTFGRVPLFFYLLHLPLIHFAALVCRRYTGHGFDLLGVYVTWLSFVIALYPVCAWFAKVKSHQRGGFLSYL